jgi:hypothetical protein
MAPAKKSTNKSSAKKANANAGEANLKKNAAKAGTAKVGTAKANAVAHAASQKQAVVNDGEDIETDIAEDDDIDDEGGDDVAEPKAKPTTRSGAKGVVSEVLTQRPTTRPTNANQHPGAHHKALDKKRRTKEEMIEVRRQEAEQKRRKEEAEMQKKVERAKAVDRVARYEMELANDAYNDTPLPRNRRGLPSDAVVDHCDSDQDDNSAREWAPVESDVEMSDDEVSARASKRKGRAARDVEGSVILETSASEGEDRPKKKAKGKAADTHVLSESDVEIVDNPEPKPLRKIPKKTPIRDAIIDKKNIDQNLGIDKTDKARSSDAPGKLKPQRYRFLTMSPMLTLDETTVFYYTISANKDGQKQSGLIKNWVDTVAKSKAASAAASNSRASSTLQASATSKSKSRPIKREGAVLDFHDIGGLSDHDEIQGAERDAALKSPPKNGVRATSSVSN